MKTRQEDFDKLKQLDRIEYLLRYDRIEEKLKVEVGFSIAKVFYFMLCFSLLLFITGYSAFGINFVIPIFQKFMIFMKILLVLFVIGFLIDILTVIKKIGSKRKLYDKFFNVKPVNKIEYKSSKTNKK